MSLWDVLTLEGALAGEAGWPISFTVEVWTRTQGPTVTLLVDLQGQDEGEPTWLRP